MATIVYDGVGGGGDLFADIKFFILQRVPFRQRWKELIESNGGEIVMLEKQADIVIADHARKDCPTGSISWKYIEQSAKKGALEDIEDYRAGQVTHTIREVGSSQPTRGGRTPFTAEDDRILTEWVVKAERNGASIKGNEIYKQLEAKNPRHTFQSWRDHWIKALAHLPRPDVPEDEAYSSSGDPESTAPPNSRNIPAQTQRVRHQLLVAAPASPDPFEDDPPTRAGPSRPVPRHVNVPQKQSGKSPLAKSTEPDKSKEGRTSSSLSSTPFPAKSAGGNNFSNEEKQLLLYVYEDAMKIDKDRVIDAWAAWAVEHPNHTAQEWRNYFVKVVVPEKRAQKLSREEVSAMVVDEPSDIIPRSSPSQDVPARPLEISDSQATVPETVPSQDSDKKASNPYLTDEQLFKRHLVQLAATLEEKLIVNFDPVICGRAIPLFKLWQVVQSVELGGYDEVTGRNLWPQVARRLNFNDFQHSNAHLDLRTCYEEILADFEMWLDYRESQVLTESQENAMIESQLRQTAARETQNAGEQIMEADAEEDYDDDLDDDLDTPSSMPQPPLASSPKRSFHDDLINEDATHKKRQRIDKGKGKELEIPSTPEDVIGNNQVPRPSYQRSPLNFASSVIAADDEDEPFLSPIPRPNFSRPSTSLPQRIVEPETQDFKFTLQDNDDRDSFVSLSSPSRKKTQDGSIKDTAPEHPMDDVDANHSSLLPSLNEIRPDTDRGIAAIHGNLVDDTSTQSQTESQREKDLRLREFVDHYVALGYSDDIVIEALEATTMETGDAGFVMEQLMNGDGIPENHRGVWTTWDDEAVDAPEGSDEFRRIVEKHGTKRVLNRNRFLHDQKEVRRESEGAKD